MIPIPVVWTVYRSIASGQVRKLVVCEHCSTDYVYVLEREGEGVGTSVYMTNETGARDHAAEAAGDTLRQYLENDFDPVPCPVCGHYQLYMFPKLYAVSPALQLARLAVLVLGCVGTVGALYWGATYARHPGDRALGRALANGALLAVLGLIGAALWALERVQARRFNPNAEAQQARIAKGQLRAVTRADLEAAQEAAKGCEREDRDQFIEHLRQKAREDEVNRAREDPRPNSV